MEFIRWTILGWEKLLFKDGAIYPIVLLNLMLMLLAFMIHVVAGYIFVGLSLIFWGLVAYVFISREVKAFYAKYEAENERGSKTTR